MAIDEKTRLDLRNKFEELIGPRLAHVTMEAMPPLDYNQLATKTHVANLGIELRGQVTELRGSVPELGCIELRPIGTPGPPPPPPPVATSGESVLQGAGMPDLC